MVSLYRPGLGLLGVADTQVSTTAHTVSAWSLLAQLVIGLAVILFIILVATKLLGGKGRRLVGPGRRPMPISVLARQSMGKGVSVVIVQAGPGTYLLGVTQHQVTRLDELDPESLAGLDQFDPDFLADQTVTNPGSNRPRGLSPVTSKWDEPVAGRESFLRKLQDRTVRR
jgi:flagellar biogenesis protein FliO